MLMLTKANSPSIRVMLNSGFGNTGGRSVDLFVPLYDAYVQRMIWIAMSNVENVSSYPHDISDLNTDTLNIEIEKGYQDS